MLDNVVFLCVDLLLSSVSGGIGASTSVWVLKQGAGNGGDSGIIRVPGRRSFPSASEARGQIPTTPPFSQSPRQTT